jgi:uncharacterized protein YoxC
MSGGEIAGIIAALAFLVLALAIAVPLVKLGKVMDEASSAIKGVVDESLPLIGGVATTVDLANSQIQRIDAITRNVETVSENVASFTQVFGRSAQSPAVRTAAMSYSLRRAMKARKENPSKRKRKRA